MKSSNPERGIFITFEGIEGSGKSTQAEILAQALRSAGYRVKLTKEPGGTPLGNAIRRILLKSRRLNIKPLSELFLYLAERHQHVEEVIREFLKKKYIVISDRFSDSSIAYQGYGRNLGEPLVSNLDSMSRGGILPDLTILLDCPVTQGIKRARKKGPPDRIEREDRAFHERVRQGFLDLAKKEKERIVVIKANGSEAVIARKIMEIVRRRFKLDIP